MCQLAKYQLIQLRVRGERALEGRERWRGESVGGKRALEGRERWREESVGGELESVGGKDELNS
jgi:hypothetical protein